MSGAAVVIYLWAPDDETAERTFDELAARCEAYAFRFCWNVVETIRDIGGVNEYFDRSLKVHAFKRTGLDQVFALLRQKQAVIVLTPDPRMVGGTSLVFNAVCERVEKYGFVQVIAEEAATPGGSHA